jgi:two-component system chemotaxis response regulator CheY
VTTDRATRDVQGTNSQGGKSQGGKAVAGSVLLVDDSAADRSKITQMLKGAGVETVHACDSAFEAYNLLKTCRVDLLMIDVIMPSIGGIRLLRALRQTEQTAEVPVIMITASREVAHLREARAAWADGYLLKPFSASGLATMMASSLRGKGPTRSEGVATDGDEHAALTDNRVDRLYLGR